MKNDYRDQMEKEQTSLQDECNRLVNQIMFECHRCRTCNGLVVNNRRAVIQYLKNRMCPEKQLDFLCGQVCNCEAAQLLFQKFARPKMA